MTDDPWKVWAKFKDDDVWGGNGKQGIGGTLFFRWLEQIKADPHGRFDAEWPKFAKKYPEYSDKPYRLVASLIHQHYYESNH